MPGPDILPTIVWSPTKASAGCAEWDRLFQLFVSAVSEMVALQAEQSEADPLDDPERTRVHRLLREAAGNRKRAKDALLQHLRAHASCGIPAPPAASLAR